MLYRLKIRMREMYTLDILEKVEIKDYYVVINGKNFFDQPIKNDKISYNNITKIATGQKGDCTTGFLPVYIYFKKHYKLISID